MKKLTLPVLLLTAAMLVACGAGAVVVPGSTTQAQGATSTEAPVTNCSCPPATPLATAPVATTAPYTPISYPVLYERPEITGTHDEVVPSPAFDNIKIVSDSSGVYGNLSPAEILEKFENKVYMIALVTPLELNAYDSIRIEIDHVYEEHIPADIESKREFYHEILHRSTVPVICSTSSVSRNDSEINLNATANGIPVSTTGGKYVMILDLVIWNIDGTEYCREDYYLHAFPLTWELDMDSVPGSTGDDWNRPPYIGKAEYYYAFGFGDVWERYMAK